MNILITGSTSGIGFLTGITLAYRKHNVYMTTHTNEQLNTLNSKLKSLNINVNTFKLDITNNNDLKIIDELDLDVLINHAGIGIGGCIIDLDIEKVKENFEVNFFSSYRLLQKVTNNFIKEKKSGKVVITSSIAGIVPIEFLGSYCSSKASITMMAKCLDKELRSINSNIKVKIIEPGAYKTGFNQKMIDSIELSMKKDSIFYDKRFKIHKKLINVFKLIENNNLDSIVIKIIEAVESNDNKLIFRAPFLQCLFTKIYRIF